MNQKDYNSDLLTLLSAYLDGELSQVRTEKVEQLLVKDKQACELLEQLRGVSEIVGSLPRTEAPQDLAENVLMDLERDLLLDKNVDLAELKGQKHLQLRKFAAAAAMILLTGAIVFFIYDALRSPTPITENPPQVSAVKQEPPKLIPQPQRSNDTPALAKAEKVEEPAPKKVDFVLPQAKYSFLKLQINNEVQAKIADTLEQILTAQGIVDVIRTQLDKDRQQYAFMCSVDQFQKVFQNLRQADNLSIDLIVSDQKRQREILIADADESQAMTLAGEANRQVQLAKAREFSSDDIISTENKPINETVALMEWIARDDEPDLPKLHLLGPRRLISNQSPESASPAKDIKEPPSVFTANKPGRANDIAQANEVETFSEISPDNQAEAKSLPATMVAVVLILRDIQQNPQSTTQQPPQAPAIPINDKVKDSLPDINDSPPSAPLTAP